MKSKKCEVCHSNAWIPVYKVKIRDGIFGNYFENAEVKECNKCKIQRLCEDKFIGLSSNINSSYRQKLSMGTDEKLFRKQ